MFTEDWELSPEQDALESVVRMNKDLRVAARTLSAGEARYLVDMYYVVQANRIRASAQVREAEKLGEPNMLLAWTLSNADVTEKGIRAALLEFVKTHEVGQWLLSIHGIGPVIAAGLMAHIDITKAPTAGHIWRFAGLDPTTSWLGKVKSEELVELITGKKSGKVTREQVLACANEVHRNPKRFLDLFDEGKLGRQALVSLLSRRPWNARLKSLCWKAGKSFVMLRNSPKDIYGRVYESRKAYEIQRNESGGNAATAARQLREKKYKQNETRACLETGKLSPGQIDARAQRYAVKLFLAHLQHVMWESKYDEAPVMPYVIEHLGHVNYIAPPNWTRAA